ncbi:alkaline phosphatase [Algoriphagus namhaensis]
MRQLRLSIFLWLLPILVFSQKGYRVHSHNDYLRNVPFWEAFGAGAASIEVDVLLVDGEILVAHELESTRPERTLRSLYLEPILKAAELDMLSQRNFDLLVDLKTEAYSTLAAVIEESTEFADLLYSAENPEGPKLIISGNRPAVAAYEDYPEWIFFDYQSKSLTPDLPWRKIAMVSLSFRQFSVWNGKGRMVEAEREKLIEFIENVHKYDKPVRFWATPDSKSAWRAFHDLGVDYINTDEPVQAADYLSKLSQHIYQYPNKQAVYRPKFDVDDSDLPLQNILLLIGDGNGLAQLSAGLFANGGSLNLTQIKNVGLIKTQASDDFTTDSAAGATAFATGKKTNNRALGVSPDGEILANLPEILVDRGFTSGLITTDRVTGATPAAFYAHHPERDDSFQIAAFLANSPLDLVMGGGKDAFSPFLNQMSAAGYSFADSLSQIGALKSGKVAFFSSAGSNLSMLAGRGNFLSQSVNEALAFLQAKDQPIFLMLESAMIDSGGHANSSATIVTEVLDFDQVVGEVLRFADENPGTLVLITADHETGGVSLPQGKMDQGEVELGFHSDDHTGILVPIFAYGAHSGEFRGVYDNTEIFHKLIRLINFSVK